MGRKQWKTFLSISLLLAGSPFSTCSFSSLKFPIWKTLKCQQFPSKCAICANKMIFFGCSLGSSRFCRNLPLTCPTPVKWPKSTRWLCLCLMVTEYSRNRCKRAVHASQELPFLFWSHYWSVFGKHGYFCGFQCCSGLKPHKIVLNEDHLSKWVFISTCTIWVKSQEWFSRCLHSLKGVLIIFIIQTAS